LDNQKLSKIGDLISYLKGLNPNDRVLIRPNGEFNMGNEMSINTSSISIEKGKVIIDIE